MVDRREAVRRGCVLDCKMLRGVVLLCGVFLCTRVSAVDKSNFKTCEQSSFCKRNRELAASESSQHYAVDPASVAIGNTGCSMELVHSQRKDVLVAEIHALKGNVFRFKVREKDPLRERYEVKGALVGEPTVQKCSIQRSSEGLEITSATAKVLVAFSPFKMNFMLNNEIAVVLNSRGLMNFECYHKRRSSTEAHPEEGGEETKEPDVEGQETEQEVKEEEEEQEEEEEEEEVWEEKFKSHTDSNPFGPSSVGLDFSFPGVEHVYGIPEHADTLSLKTTKNGDPYRLLNLDVFEYELDSRMALYGSIPLLLAHNWSKTVGIFWHNAAETWVDISNSAADKSILGKLLSYFKTDDEVPQTDTHWFSESGIMDVFVLLGPRPRDVFQQYSSLTGTTPLPPLFSLAYHQCRWNYNDEDDVASVDSNFDVYDIPYDVLWLDIEHTDGKRYFTWDSHKFPHPEEMQNKLAAKSRKMVTIVDPHIKRDSNYHIHKEADSNDLYVKTSDGSSVYEGWCWPGSSSWIDFMDPAKRQWWAGQFSFEKYKGSTPNLYIWNDMNEPSVFNGPEAGIHKDAVHFGGWENREVHNIYGMFVHEATAEGLLQRSGGTERPFVLSRAFFAGSQRFGAVWTGDNIASWEHLKMSLPMVLSVGVAGLPFVGADVGGFFGNPSEELLVRWYQAGVHLPFFRAHAHLDTRRREPWLFEPRTVGLIRQAVRTRYSLLPLWYTLFYESYSTGMPVARPVWMEFPRDKNTYDMEDQFMIGNSLMVKPVTDEHATSVQLYLPGNNVRWYDFQNHVPYIGGRRHSVSAPLEKIPVFQKHGTIIPQKLRIRRSSSLMANDPYTLVVALDSENHATGQLYVDDGHSMDYQNGSYLLREFVFSANSLHSRSSSPAGGSFSSKSWVERVIIVGYRDATPAPASVRITHGTKTRPLLFTYDSSMELLTIRKPDVNIATDFTISIN